MKIYCPECSATLKLPKSVVGKRLKCPKCRNIFTAKDVPLEESSATSPVSLPAEYSPLGRLANDSDAMGEGAMRRALLVGINGYGESSGLVPLRFAEADAAAIGSELRSRCAFETQTLLGPEATRDAIEKALLTAGQGETFLFFFAGHGQHLTGQYRLHPVDSTAGGLRTLSFGDIARQWHHGFGYGQVMAILDACRSQTRRGGRGQTVLGEQSVRDIQAATRGSTWVEVLYGCSEGQCSYEVPELHHGLLTRALLETIRTFPGRLDSRILAGAAADWMTDWCENDPEQRHQQVYRYAQPSLRRQIVLVGSVPKV